MKVASAILAGFVIAMFSYGILFFDFRDFMDGMIMCLPRGRAWRGKSWLEEDHDKVWSGFRFFLFMLLTFGGGFLVYCELCKHFG